MGDPAGEHKTPQREGSYIGEGLLCVGPPSGEGGMDLYVRMYHDIGERPLSPARGTI